MQHLTLIVAKVATYLPQAFRWSPPTLEAHLSDEPDHHDLNARLLYDHTEGRLGSDIRLRLKGSDDDTRSSCLVRTEVGLRLAQAVPPLAHGVHVVATFRCEESGREFDHYDEAGLSDLKVDYTSRPFARLDLDPPLGARVYDKPFLRSYAQHAEPTVMVGGLDFDLDDVAPVPHGKKAVFTCTLDELPPRRGNLLAVGIEDEVVARSDDTTYIVRLRSHWFLESVDLSTY